MPQLDLKTVVVVGLAIEVVCNLVMAALWRQGRRQYAEACIGTRTRTFLLAKGADQAGGERLLTAEDLQRPLGLRAPVGIGGYFHIAHGVVFGTGGGHGFSFV